MIEIATESDIWKLFWNNPPKDGHRRKGEGLILYDALRHVLDAKSFGANGTDELELTDEKRFYFLVGSANLRQEMTKRAVVRQRDLRDVARSVNNSPGYTLVGYLGTRA